MLARSTVSVTLAAGRVPVFAMVRLYGEASPPPIGVWRSQQMIGRCACLQLRQEKANDAPETTIAIAVKIVRQSSGVSVGIPNLHRAAANRAAKTAKDNVPALTDRLLIEPE
jgi:hypothetical protein